MKEKINKALPIITLITYLLMIIVNALANIIPINGITTGEVSDKYANLFAPAPITFSIWGVIYILLLLYVIYQLRSFKLEDKALFIKVNILFSISSIANTIWMVMWHYQFFEGTVFLMITILVCLIMINMILHKHVKSTMDTLMIKLPFSVYFGWITVATIANITTYLVSINWGRMNLSESFWTNIILLIGALIAVLTTIRFKSYPYALVVLWAYLGILIKHISVTGYNGTYISVIITTVLGMVLIVMAIGFLIKNQFFTKKPEST